MGLVSKKEINLNFLMFLSLNLEKTKKNLVYRPITAPPRPIYSIFYGLFPRITQKSHSKTLDLLFFFIIIFKQKKFMEISHQSFIQKDLR
jgi:hypothetical protein